MSLERVVEPSAHPPGREDRPENDLRPRSWSCTVARNFAISMERHSPARIRGVEGGKGAQSNGGNERQEAPGFRDLNHRMDRVSRGGLCECEEEGQHGKSHAVAVEGRKEAQSNGGNERQEAPGYCYLTLRIDRVSRGGLC